MHLLRKLIVASLAVQVAGGVTAWAASPELVSAVSRKTHGDAGDFDLDLPLGADLPAVEGRQGGPTTVILTFSEPVTPADGTPDETEVTLSSGTVGAVSISIDKMTIELSGVPDASCLSIAVSGLQWIRNRPVDDTGVLIGVLTGAVDADDIVDVVDMSRVKGSLFTMVDGENFRADVNADGAIDVSDMSKVKGNLFSTVTCLPPEPEGMVLIPAGEFQMGDAFAEGQSNELPVHTVFVDAFYMDKYEVTNGQYAEYLNAANAQGLVTVSGGVVYQSGSDTSYPQCNTYSYDDDSQIHWNGSTFTITSGKQDHPMGEVSWYGAAAYANWRSARDGRQSCYNLPTWTCDFSKNGYRMATEAEWEYAARGGVAGRRFPWSDTNTIQHSRANYWSWSNYSYDTSPTRGYHPAFDSGGFPYTSPVGYFAPNGYGLYDMAGNVWEWCNDRYDSGYYSGSPYQNPRGPAIGSDDNCCRVFRGGSWYYIASGLRCANRGAGRPGGRDYNFGGFRLVLATDPAAPTLDLWVEDLKVAQVLQDDSLPLIAGRPTLARVSVAWSGAQDTVKDVSAKLRIYVDGALYRTQSARTSDRVIHRPVDWHDDDQTFNFVFTLPESDDVDFEVEVNADHGIPEADYVNNTARVDDRAVECRRRLSIAYVPIDYRPNAPDSGLNLPDPNLTGPGSGDAFVRGIYPTPDLNYYPVPFARWRIDINSWDGQAGLYLLGLAIHRWTLWPRPDFIYAWLPGNPYSGNGAALRGKRVAFGNTDPDRYQRTFAHELGHCFGLNHAGGSDPSGDRTLGAQGVDVENLLALGRIKPSSMLGIMVPGRLTDEAWADLASYNFFLDSDVLACAEAEALEDEGPMLLVAGMFDPSEPAATIEEVAEVSAVPTPNEPEGVLILRAYHVAPTPTLLYELRFTSDPVDCPEDTECPELFTVLIPAHGAEPGERVDRIEIVLAETGEVLAEQVRSNATPAIGFDNLAPGQHLAHGMTITWQGSDEDGDELHYTISYSWDDGQSWLPLAVDTTETSFILDTTMMPGSDAATARLRLTATDGINTATAELSDLTLDAKKPPSVHVVSPRGGETAVEGGGVYLSASVHDPEDGVIDDTSIEWVSDLDGPVGTGASLLVDTLSVGTHEITVTATDSDGMSGSASVTIDVVERPSGTNPGDFNHDGNVDGLDVEHLRACAGGPAVPHDNPNCEDADLDDDGDVDQGDFAAVQRCFGTFDEPADPDCAR